MVKNRSQSLELPSGLYLCVFQVLLLAVVIGIVLLDPIWSSFSPPFIIERVWPPITGPVDGPYYLLNAERGYTWDASEPLNLWFHPFLSVLVRLLPNWFSGNIWFWLIGLGFAFASLITTYQITSLFVGNNLVPSKALFLVVVIPGGLGIATGNPEIPTLFFTSILLLSVNQWHSYSITFLSASLAILTKPNALYMVPALLVYAAEGYRRSDRKLTNHALLGTFAIITMWLGWMIFVDIKTGQPGAYWGARLAFAKFVAGNPRDFFLELVRGLVEGIGLRDQIRYPIAVLIPLVNLWVISSIAFSREVHRYALSVGNLAMFAIILWQGNPNKAIVYSTTLPGYFSAYIMMFMEFQKHWRSSWQIVHSILFGLMLLYFGAMLLVYIVGTPLGWYY